MVSAGFVEVDGILKLFYLRLKLQITKKSCQVAQVDREINGTGSNVKNVTMHFR